MKILIKNKPVAWCLSLLGVTSLFVVPFLMNQPTAGATSDFHGKYDPSDLDGDGMSDAWEIVYFGSPEARDGSEDDDLDDILNIDEWRGGTNPLQLNPFAIAESGYKEIFPAETEIWHTIPFDGAYSSPVVVVSTAAARGFQANRVRVRNVQSQSFELLLQGYKSTAAIEAEVVSWLVVEEGVHELPGGLVIQAGITSITADETSVSFIEPFERSPVVLNQISNNEGERIVTPNVTNITTFGFDNVSNQIKRSKNLSWIAVEEGKADTLAGFLEAEKIDLLTRKGWSMSEFDLPLNGLPSFMVQLQTNFSDSAAKIFYRNVTSNSVQFRIRQGAPDSVNQVARFIASPGLFHVLPTTGDRDADGIADAYELANGLVVGEFDYYEDKDGDGLSNAEEAFHDTRADLADTDGDLISDFEENYFLESEELATDVGEFQMEETIHGANYTNVFGEWVTKDNDLAQDSVRGWAEYEMNIAAEGVYSVEVDLAPHSGGRQSRIPVVISIDGELVSRELLELKDEGVATAKILTPWLDFGSHNVRVFIDNTYSFRRAKIQQLRVYSATGADSNGNGSPDWTEIRSQRQNGLIRSVAQSRTSPICLEGRARFSELIKSNQSLDIQKAPNDTWYADLYLSEETPTQLELIYENGAVVEQETVEWVTTNLLEEKTLFIRHGDALRLSASSSQQGTPSETAILSIDGTQYETTADQPITYQFNESGAQIIDVFYTGADGVQTNHQVTVNVIARTPTNSPVCVVGFKRDWAVDTSSSNVIVQIDDDVTIFDSERLSGNSGYSYSIATKSPESQYAVTRLGHGGAILSSVEIKSLSLNSSDKTGVTYVDELGDGTYLLEMPVIVSEALEGVTIRCDIFLAGVMYPDGSRRIDLQAEDFDEFGSHTLEFIKPQNAHSNCHRFSVWQNGKRIAKLN